MTSARKRKLKQKREKRSGEREQIKIDDWGVDRRSAKATSSGGTIEILPDQLAKVREESPQ
jgi:hypothetical protein